MQKKTSMQHSRSEDREYNDFLAHLQGRFSMMTDRGKESVFTTDATDLFDRYLSGIAPDKRQHHRCHSCRRFVDNFGGLVTINAMGNLEPLMWSQADVPDELVDAVGNLITAVRAAKVTGVFISSKLVYGEPTTGNWHHMAVAPPSAMIYTGILNTDSQAMAEKLEDYNTIRRALSEYSEPMLVQAVKLLSSESLFRGEKTLGQAQWLLDLIVLSKAVSPRLKSNLIWHQVARAPAGFCHPRSSMISTLLEDIVAGLPFDLIAQRFGSKMSPLQYQRPTAPPKDGTIAEAEKIIEKLKAEGSLDRRYCRFDEVPLIWQPTVKPPAEVKSGGIFSRLRSKAKKPEIADIETPPKNISWEKFRVGVLEVASEIELSVRAGLDKYGVLVTAVNPDAPPIIQWDTPEFRNPVSWYMYPWGSPPSQYGLDGYTYHKISGICLGPSQWRNENEFDHHSQRVFLLLDGAKETMKGGSALFPEMMRSEFHGIRSVIEAYSRSKPVEGLGEPHACGLVICKSDKTTEVKVRVTVDGLKFSYIIDRWE